MKNKTLLFAALGLFALFAFLFVLSLADGGKIFGGNGGLTTASFTTPEKCIADNSSANSEVCKQARCADNCDDNDPTTLDFCRGASYTCEHMKVDAVNSNSANAEANGDGAKSANATSVNVSISSGNTADVGSYTYAWTKNGEILLGNGIVSFLLRSVTLHYGIAADAWKTDGGDYVIIGTRVINSGPKEVTLSEPPALRDAELKYSANCGKDTLIFPLTIAANSYNEGVLCYEYPTTGVNFPLILDLSKYGGYVLIYRSEMNIERGFGSDNGGSLEYSGGSGSGGGNGGGDTTPTTPVNPTIPGGPYEGWTGGTLPPATTPPATTPAENQLYESWVG